MNKAIGCNSCHLLLRSARAQAVRVRQKMQIWSFVMARTSALMPVRLVIPIMSRAMAVAPAAASAQVDLLLSSTEIFPIG